MECCLHSVKEKHGQNQKKVLWVVGITLVMMVIEIFTSVVYGSMALLADGVHMGTHFFALSITLLAYYYAKKHEKNQRFSFGTGKISSLGGFSSAIVLLISAFGMVYESAERLFNPVEISYSQSIGVAMLGLLVNLLCAFLLFDHHHHHHDHEKEHHHHHHDHNLKAAYLHVVADALTSILAIVALLIAQRFGFVWFDPLVGILGAAVVGKWAWRLLRETGAVLLDYDPNDQLKKTLQKDLSALSKGEWVDLHLWRIDENRRCMIGTLAGVSEDEKEPVKNYLKSHPRIAHFTVQLDSQVGR